MLSEMKINDYIDLLASDAPAPGGGSASAPLRRAGGGAVRNGCGADARQKEI